MALNTAGVLGQVIVYENTGGALTYATAVGPQPGGAGDEVTLSGGGTTVGTFTVGLIGSGITTGAIADLALSFYTPGPTVTAQVGGIMVSGPSVGTQIGSTVTQLAVPLQNGAFDFTFTGVNVTVPGEVIWAVSILNLTPDATVGWRAGGTPTVGSSDPAFAYLNYPGAGLIPEGAPTFDLNALSPTSNLVATITTVPESGVYSIIFGVLCLGLIWGRRRHSNRGDVPNAER